MMSYARRIETDRRERHAVPLARMLRSAGVWLALALLRWQELAQQRRRLLSLDDRMLKDIGITRAEATREGARPFWDVPGVDGTRWP
jgi:uncharacterized protein YjiS (DUF1127 family)